MHDARGANDPATKSLADALMTETYAQNGHAARHFCHQVETNTGFVWRAWPGGNQDARGRHGANLTHGQGVVPDRFYFGSQLSEVLDQVPGEGVIIVDHQDHRLCTCGYRIKPVSIIDQSAMIYPASPLRGQEFYDP